jgi:hypothetical protein
MQAARGGQVHVPPARAFNRHAHEKKENRSRQK